MREVVNGLSICRARPANAAPALGMSSQQETGYYGLARGDRKPEHFRAANPFVAFAIMLRCMKTQSLCRVYSNRFDANCFKRAKRPSLLPTPWRTAKTSVAHALDRCRIEQDGSILLMPFLS